MSWKNVLDDDRDAVLDKFRGKAGSRRPSQEYPFGIHLFDWLQGEPRGREHSVQSVEQLQTSDNVAVRLIFAHRDAPRWEYVDQLTRMFRHCDIPTHFVSESFRDVSQSFGSRTDDSGTWIWFHFLAKNAVSERQNRQSHTQPYGLDQDTSSRDSSSQSDLKNQTVTKEKSLGQSQANYLWTKTGVVLRVSSPTQSNSATGTSTSPRTNVLDRPEITLFCFGPPDSLLPRFQRLCQQASCEDLQEDPYMLGQIIIEQLYVLLDGDGWQVAWSFGPIESSILQGAQYNPVEAGRQVDFTGLHNLSKHLIYLKENCDSALATLDCFRAFHETRLGKNPNESQKALQLAFAYQKTLFESTKRRLSSLDKRMANIVQLSFHLVTQTDSRIMQSEAQSMKTIAVMTLLFMPLSTVATVFGSEFFVLKDDAPFHLQVSRDFWILWLVAVPLTILVVICWRFWYWDARFNLTGQMPGFGGRHMYMGMKRLARPFEKRKQKAQIQTAFGNQDIELNVLS